MGAFYAFSFVKCTNMHLAKNNLLISIVIGKTIEHCHVEHSAIGINDATTLVQKRATMRQTSGASSNNHSLEKISKFDGHRLNRENAFYWKVKIIC
jgi:hypothetical protein